MRRNIAAPWVAFLACLVLPTPGGAVRPLPWTGPAFSATPQDLFEASDHLVWGNSTAEMLVEDVSFVFDATGRHTRTVHTVMRFKTEEAAHGWATVAVSWNPWYQERPELRARVITADHVEHWLEPTTLAEGADEGHEADQFFEGKVLRGPLPAIGAGCIVETEQVLREKSPMFEHGVTKDYPLGHFGAHVPVRATRIHVDAPVDLPLHTELRGYTARLKRTTEGDRQHVELDVGPLPATWEAELLPPHDVPSRPIFGLSTGKSWTTVAAAYSQVVDAQVAKLPDELVRSWVGDAHGREAVARALLAKLHDQIRYTGLEMGAGAIVPRPPQDTIQRGYGDCKDMASLLVAMLRRVKIPASVALLRTGWGEVSKELPGVGEFNHAIAYVPGSPPLWIDATDPDAIIGELPLVDQGRLALIASPESKELVKTPEASATDNRITTTREVFFADAGFGRIIETREASGAPAEDLRNAYRSRGLQGIRRTEESQVKAAFGADSVGQFITAGLSGDEASTRVTIEGTHAHVIQTDDREAWFDFNLSPLANRLPWWLKEREVPLGADRKLDIELPEVFQAELRYVFSPPAGYALRPLPDEKTIELAPFGLHRFVAVDPSGTLTVAYRFNVSKRRLTPHEVLSVRAGVQELLAQTVHVVFENLPEKLLAAGRIREGLAEYEKLTAAHPTALYQAKRSRALLSLGAGVAARAAAREAVHLDPASFDAQRTLAWVLEHNQIGRRYAAGLDFDGAVSAYTAALRLRADDIDLRADYATLLQHDPQGGYRTARSKLKAAVEQYRILRERSKSHRFDEPLVELLMRLERYNEVVSLGPSVVSHPGLRGLVLAAMAISRGRDATSTEALKLVPDAVERRVAYVKEADELLWHRRYSLAADFYLLAADGAPRSEALSERARQARQTQRCETVVLPADAPSTVVLRLLCSLASEGEEEGAEFFSDQLSSEARREMLRPLLHGLQDWLPPERAQGWMVAVDRLVASAEPRQEGDRTTGYRITLHASEFPGINGRPFFVAGEPGTYRIRATGETLAELGQEVLKRIDAGDLASARRWLEWARENPSIREDPMWRARWTAALANEAEAMRAAAAVLVATTKTSRPDAAPKAALTAIYDGSSGDQALAGASFNIAPEQWRGAEAHGHGEAAELKVAEARLRETPWDEHAVLAVTSLSAAQGDFDHAERIGRAYLNSGRESPRLLLALAWYALCRGQVTEQALEDARDALRLSTKEQTAALLTLAALYAERGRLLEARELMEKVVASHTGPLQPPQWFVYGRIYEEYGLKGDAAAAYERALEAGDSDAASVSTQAARRLRLLKTTDAEGK